jgi:hypothetical protein
LRYIYVLEKRLRIAACGRRDKENGGGVEFKYDIFDTF